MSWKAFPLSAIILFLAFVLLLSSGLFELGGLIKFGLELIQKKCGSQSTGKEFKRLLKTIVEQDDRRHAVIWTPEKLSADFYTGLKAEIDNGGGAALHRPKTIGAGPPVPLAWPPASALGVFHVALFLRP